MITVLAFIFMFGLLVFVHEFGHLIFAKRAGMLVREFAIGFGPKIYSVEKNETLYTVRLLPIGGYVRVAGEDPEIIELRPGHHIGLMFNDKEEVTEIIVNNKDKYPDCRLVEVEKVDLDHELKIVAYDLDDDAQLTFSVNEKAFFIMDENKTQIAPYERQFAAKTVGQRGMQLFAGPMMNFLLAIAIFFIIGLVQGVPAEHALIDDILSDTPAEEAGFQPGDVIVQIDDEKVDTWEAFTNIIRENPDQELTMLVERSGKEDLTEIKVTPEANIDEASEENVGQIGVYPGFEKSFLKTIKYGFIQTYETTKLILVNLMMLITGQLSLEALSGPVGIYDATDQIVQTGFMNFLLWTAMLSINLGIINLVPLPALDGGRLMFVAIEAVRGKPMDPQKEGFVHLIGFALLMLLMIVVTWNDIQRLFL